MSSELCSTERHGTMVTLVCNVRVPLSNIRVLS